MNAECETPGVASSFSVLEQPGFVLVPQFASTETISELREAVPEISGSSARAGIRNLFRVCSQVSTFASSTGVLDKLSTFARTRPFAVRGILFNKTTEANWVVAWHQDLTIAVRERRDVPGFGPWSVKEGIPHVQPPAELLARMITLRLHLDDCDAGNGALRVLPGSHQHGKLSAAELAAWRTSTPEHLCVARAGDALLMRPLLLHASSPAIMPRNRRVIHLEFAIDELPGGLVWAERIPA